MVHKSKIRNMAPSSKFLAMVMVYSMLFPLPIKGDDIQIADSQEPIRAHYETWSLFLVCGTEWLLPENRERLANLYQQFGAFGRSIGPKNLAVWFRRVPFDVLEDADYYHKKEQNALADYVDVNRGSQYCDKYQLLPSKSPYILVTSTDPALNEKVGDFVALSLNDATSSDITSILNKLSDQILVEGLDKMALDSELYWLGWQRAYEAIKRSFGSLLKKTKLEINTKFFKLEIDGGRT